MTPTPIDTGKAHIELLGSGVISLTWQHNARINQADIEVAMVKVHELCNGNPTPLLVHINDLEGVSYDTRAVFSTPSTVSRIALLGSSAEDYVFASYPTPDFYPCPTRFFSNEDEALTWLLQTDAA